MTKNQVIQMVGCVVAAILIFGGIAVTILGFIDNEGIEDGKSYDLAYTYLSDLKIPGVGSLGKGTIPGRTFDFADRNLPRNSIVVPLRDERGPLVFENASLKPGTVRKQRIKIAKREIEGIKYPAYEYVIWEFNLNHKTEQKHIPVVTPKK